MRLAGRFYLGGPVAFLVKGIFYGALLAGGTMVGGQFTNTMGSKMPQEPGGFYGFGLRLIDSTSIMYKGGLMRKGIGQIHINSHYVGNELCLTSDDIGRTLETRLVQHLRLKDIQKRIHHDFSSEASNIIHIWNGVDDIHPLIREADIVIMGAPDSTGAQRNLGMPGAEDGPNAVMHELLKRDLSRLSGKKIVYIGNVRVPPTNRKTTVTRKDGEQISFDDALSETYADVRIIGEKVLEINPNITWLQLGGDHGLAYPFNAPLSKVHGPFGFLNVDAHFDARDPKDPARPRGPNSGTPFRYLIIKGHALAKNVVFLGIDPLNKVYKELRGYLEARGVGPIFTDKEVHEEWVEGTDSFSSFIDVQIKHVVSGVKIGHVSIDIDGINKFEAPGCSAQNEKGITGNMARVIARLAGANHQIHSFGVFEIAPRYDAEDGRTVKLGADLFLEFLRGRFNL